MATRKGGARSRKRTARREEPAGGAATQAATEWEDEDGRPTSLSDLEPSEEEERELAASAEREEPVDDEREEFDDGERGEPETLEEMRDRVRESELDAREARRVAQGFKRTISRLRAQRRMDALQTPGGGRETPSDPFAELPDEIEIEIDFDTAGKPRVSRDAFKKALQNLPAGARPPVARGGEEQARQLAQIQQQVNAQYQDMRDDYIDESDDPDLAEETIGQLEDAYQWLDEEFKEAARADGHMPNSVPGIIALLQDAGIAEEFEDRYPGVSLRDLVRAPTNPRSFRRVVDRAMEDGIEEPEEDPRRRRGRGVVRRTRGRARAGREARDRDRDRGDGEERGIVRRTSRSMARRGRRGDDAGMVSLERYANMPTDDFLKLPKDEIARVAEKAGLRRRRSLR